MTDRDLAIARAALEAAVNLPQIGVTAGAAINALDPATIVAGVKAEREIPLTAVDQIVRQQEEINALRARVAKLERGLKAVDQLIAESGGVYGLHLNGDMAPWAELRSGGRYEEWLRDFDAAMEVK